MTFLNALFVSSILMASWNGFKTWKRYKKIDMTVDKWHQELIQGFENAIIRVKVEKHDDTFFLYKEKTMEFVCSGRDKEEVEKNFLTRFPDKIISIEDGDENVVESMLN